MEKGNPTPCFASALLLGRARGGAGETGETTPRPSSFASRCRISTLHWMREGVQRQASTARVRVRVRRIDKLTRSRIALLFCLGRCSLSFVRGNTEYPICLQVRIDTQNSYSGALLSACGAAGAALMQCPFDAGDVGPGSYTSRV